MNPDHEEKTAAQGQLEANIEAVSQILLCGKTCV